MRVDTDDFPRSCSCGKDHHTGVKEILIEAGAIEKLEEELLNGNLKEYISPLVICDTNTHKATEEIMEDIYDRCQVLVLDAENLYADNQAVTIVENIMEEDIDLILAVGGGTIHDISRFVAHRFKVPFISVPTAASMDGFVSIVAAMNWNGMKITVPADAPMCVYADTNIFANAPQRLTASGVADMLGKYICLADWKIASLLTGEYYCSEIAELEEKALKTVKSSLRAIAAGEEDACEKLMYALILSGMAVQMTGTSRPASCAEHHMAHLWELEVLNGHPDALHGEMVTIGAVLVLREYKRIAKAIARGRCYVKDFEPEEDEALLEDVFGKKGFLEEIRKENTPEPLLEIHPTKLENCLKEIRDIIDELPDEDEFVHMLEKAGCKNSVYDIGLDNSVIDLSLRLAPYTRRRLSLLRVSKMLEIVEGDDE